MNQAVAVKRRNADESSRLSSDQIIEVFQLLKGANSIELKLIVPDSERSAIKRLGYDPVEAESRQIYFYDTPDLKLNKAGLIVRARRSRGDRGDTAIKLRPVDPATITAELQRDASFKIEVDAMPGGYVCSATSKGRCTAKEILGVSDGKVSLDSILSREQREFYAAHAPAGISINDLVPLGPTFVLLIKQQPKGFDRKIVIELWLYPDGSRVLEISTKGVPEEAFQLAALFRAYITSCGITLGDQAVTKTSSALAYFSKHLKSK